MVQDNLEKHIPNVLLVDDDPIATFLNKRLIEGLKVVGTIETAANGREALEKITFNNAVNKSYPDVIFLDINMPIMDGFEFMENYKSMGLDNKYNIRIVVLTTSSNPVDLEKMKKLGVTKYLNKPLNSKTVLEAILSQ